MCQPSLQRSVKSTATRFDDTIVRHESWCDALAAAGLLMTPTQLRAFVTVVRHGASKSAAEELGVSEAAISNHIASLRRELDDPLFRRGGNGLVFTPGGLRLATRSVEILGLQEQTRAEVSAAAEGQRLLRLAVSSLFAEYSAPGLIEAFTSRAKDLRVELAVHAPDRFRGLLTHRGVDMAIGPRLSPNMGSIDSVQFVRYQIVPVVARRHPLAGRRITPAQAGRHQWLLGPSAVDDGAVTNRILTELGVPEARQMVFQSNEAALAEARRGAGVAFALTHRAAAELQVGNLVEVGVPAVDSHGTWTAYVIDRPQLTPAAAELLRFVTTPRAMQATLSGSAAAISRFQPSVHVTLWS